MVEEQLIARNIRDERVLQAMREVPRELFVPPALKEMAYEDRALPIGDDQSISQPYVVALTLEALALRGDETVLDIGTGSGYAAALLSRLARRVYSVERLPQLAQSARERLARLGFPVQVRCGDGTLGWPERAPFGAIAAAAAGPIVPPALAAQLELGGRLVMPLQEGDTQMLVEVKRLGKDTFRTDKLQEVRFVPLIGAQGERLMPAPKSSPASGQPQG
jgi:protein-L-isoaspartate(D-aspartate) O-methyltransferase